MRAWSTVQLGKVVQQRRETVFIDDFTEYKRCRVQLHAQGIVLRDAVPGAEIKTKKQQVCKAGDFLVAEIDAKVGGFGIVPDELEGAIVSSHYFLFEVDEAKLDRRFLDYFIRTPAFRDQVTAQGSTNYAAIRPRDVLGYEVPLPPLPEQRRIVARIEELAAKINEARELRQTSADEIEALKSSGPSKVLARCREEVGERSLEELTTRITKGESPQWQGYAYQETGPLFIRSENVLWGILDTRNTVHIPDAFHDKLSRSRLCGEDVLINLVGASIGRACIVPETLGPANINQAVAVITVNATELSSRFLLHFLLSSCTQDIIHGGKVETARPNISLGDLRELKIPIPSLSVQRRIVADLDDTQAKLDEVKKLQGGTNDELDALLPSILDKAFKEVL